MNLSFLQATQEAPARPALVAGGRIFTYADLAPRVRAAMPWVRSSGLGEAEPIPAAAGAARRNAGPADQDALGPAPRVAIGVTNELGTLVTLYALMEMGIPFVPFSSRLTAPERERLLGECRPSLVLDPGPAENAAGPAASAAMPDAARHTILANCQTARSTYQPLPDDERCLAIVYTAGTTGRPKGVVLSRAAFLASARASALNLGWRDDDRWLLALPANHVGGLSIITRCLIARAALVLAPGSDAPAIATAIARERVTLVSLVPAMLTRLLDLDPPWSPPPALRAILLGGSAAPASLLARAASAGLPVLTTYGLTETCSQVATQAYGTPPSPEEGCGRPLAGVEVRIVEGHIQVRGVSLFTSYFPRDAQASPLGDGGWFDTGDLGRLDEHGRLHVLGRQQDVIITGGENVSPAEVEEVLTRAPSVAAACVFGVPDETWGEIVAAAVVPSPAGPPNVAELSDLLARHLAPWKRPRLLCALSHLAETSSGKVDRAEVKRQALPHLKPCTIKGP